MIWFYSARPDKCGWVDLILVIDNNKIVFENSKFNVIKQYVIVKNYCSDYTLINKCEFNISTLSLDSKNTIIQKTEFSAHGLGVTSFIGDQDYFLGIKECEFHAMKKGVEVEILRFAA